jgi:hypothetical protein
MNSKQAHHGNTNFSRNAHTPNTYYNTLNGRQEEAKGLEGQDLSKNINELMKKMSKINNKNDALKSIENSYSDSISQAAPHPKLSKSSYI